MQNCAIPYLNTMSYEQQRAKTCLALFCRKSGKRQKRSKTLDCGKNIPRSRFYCLVTVVNRCVCKLNYSLCCERGRKRELILSFRSGLRRLRWVWITGKAWCIVERREKMSKRSASMTLVFKAFLKLLSAPNHLRRHPAQKVTMAAVQ